NLPLTADEQEVIDYYVRIELLRKIFNGTGETDKDGKPIGALTQKQLKDAGFTVVDPKTATQAELEAAGQQNWERSKDLFVSGYFSSAPIVSLRRATNGADAANLIDKYKALAEIKYKDLYRVAMRRSYEFTDGTSSL